jgi:cyclopropane-fatty-acyl-phospholipid synthase
MANRAEIERHYETVGRLHALRLVEVQMEHPDYSCAFFDGDFRKELWQAQEEKYLWIFKGLGFTEDLRGIRLLDVGCGWGPILNAVKHRGGSAVGLTLSSGQSTHCSSRGLDARLMDYKELKPGELGEFDGIVSLGAFEHFCSVEEKIAGRQEEVYKGFFEICAKLLRPGGRLYLQTMTWGQKVPDPLAISLDAPADSVERILARMQRLFPGSWLPDGLAQISECAGRHFNVLSYGSGRLDYIHTLSQWNEASRNLWTWRILPRTFRVALPLLWQFAVSRDARIQWEAIRRGDQRTCFVREIMGHERIFFERR